MATRRIVLLPNTTTDIPVSVNEVIQVPMTEVQVVGSVDINGAYVANAVPFPWGNQVLNIAHATKINSLLYMYSVPGDLPLPLPYSELWACTVGVGISKEPAVADLDVATNVKNAILAEFIALGKHDTIDLATVQAAADGAVGVVSAVFYVFSGSTWWNGPGNDATFPLGWLNTEAIDTTVYPFGSIPEGGLPNRTLYLNSLTVAILNGQQRQFDVERTLLKWDISQSDITFDPDDITGVRVWMYADGFVSVATKWRDEYGIYSESHDWSVATEWNDIAGGSATDLLASLDSTPDLGSSDYVYFSGTALTTYFVNILKTILADGTDPNYKGILFKVLQENSIPNINVEDGVFYYSSINTSVADRPAIELIFTVPDMSLSCPESDAVLNEEYASQLTASGGTAPYSYSIISGSLPTGLILNASTGMITGTPTAEGTFSFTAKAIDSLAVEATNPCSIIVSDIVIPVDAVIALPPLTITRRPVIEITVTLPDRAWEIPITVGTDSFTLTGTANCSTKVAEACVLDSGTWNSDECSCTRGDGLIWTGTLTSENKTPWKRRSNGTLEVILPPIEGEKEVIITVSNKTLVYPAIPLPTIGLSFAYMDNPYYTALIEHLVDSNVYNKDSRVVMPYKDSDYDFTLSVANIPSGTNIAVYLNDEFYKNVETHSAVDFSIRLVHGFNNIYCTYSYGGDVLQSASVYVYCKNIYNWFNALADEFTDIKTLIEQTQDNLYLANANIEQTAVQQNFGEYTLIGSLGEWTFAFYKSFVLNVLRAYENSQTYEALNRVIALLTGHAIEIKKIFDRRNRFTGTDYEVYCLVNPTFQYNWDEQTVFWNGVLCTIPSGNDTVTPSSTTYVYIDDTCIDANYQVVPKNSTTYPIDSLIISVITSSVTTITVLEDQGILDSGYYIYDEHTANFGVVLNVIDSSTLTLTAKRLIRSFVMYCKPANSTVYVLFDGSFGDWLATKSEVTAFHISAAIPSSSDIVVSGGNATNNQFVAGSGNVRKYNILTNTWSNLANLPNFTKDGVGGYDIDTNRIYVYGRHALGIGNPIYVYDVATNVWSTGAVAATERYCPAGALFDGILYVFGGAPGGFLYFPVGTMEYYTIATDTWTVGTSMPAPKSAFTATPAGNKIYLIAGLEERPGSATGYVFSSSVVEYNTATGVYSIVGYLPIPLISHISVRVGQDIYIMGGLTTGTYTLRFFRDYIFYSERSKRCFKFNIASGTVVETTPASEFFTEGYAYYEDNNIYVVCPLVGNNVVDKIYRYNVPENKWYETVESGGIL